MGENKTVFKIFNIFQYRQEEEFLSDMHAKGWKFAGVSFPGSYRFEKCEPEKVSYRLDYNKDGIGHKDEYVRMFSDCGWEYIMDFFGYSYFRKTDQSAEDREEIFCDEESRLEMMRRVFKGRMIPAIVMFFVTVIPQLLLNTLGFNGGSDAQEILAIFVAVIGLMYLLIFGVTAVQFYGYECNVVGESSQLKLKYTGIFALIAVMAVGMGVVLWLSNHSDYKVTETSHGYIVEAKELNSSVIREYDLKTGDTVTINVDNEKGFICLKVAADGKEPLFFADFNTDDTNLEFPLEIQEDGHYRIEIEGNHLSGNIEVVIGR